MSIVTQLLDVKQTSVGGKADLPQERQVLERLANSKFSGVVDSGFGAQGAAFFVRQYHLTLSLQKR